jgi:hypothetical protein
MDAFNASKPTNVVFGKVVSESPLKIKLDQKLILGSAQLVLSRNVTKHNIKIDNVEYTIDNHLCIDEEVIIVQLSGGQKYVVIDRIGKV